MRPVPPFRLTHWQELAHLADPHLDRSGKLEIVGRPNPLALNNPQRRRPW